MILYQSCTHYFYPLITNFFKSNFYDNQFWKAQSEGKKIYKIRYEKNSLHLTKKNRKCMQNAYNS